MRYDMIYHVTKEILNSLILIIDKMTFRCNRTYVYKVVTSIYLYACKKHNCYR